MSAEPCLSWDTIISAKICHGTAAMKMPAYPIYIKKALRPPEFFIYSVLFIYEKDDFAPLSFYSDIRVQSLQGRIYRMQSAVLYQTCMELSHA